MKLSKAHLDFYMMKKYPSPRFGEKWRERRPDVNELINYSAGVKHDYDKSNVNGFLKGKKGIVLEDYLFKLYRNPGTIINPRKRRAYAARLLRRLTKA